MASNDSENQEPVILQEMIPIQSSVNRIRAMPQEPIVATWSEDGKISVYNLEKKYESLKNNV